MKQIFYSFIITVNQIKYLVELLKFCTWSHWCGVDIRSARRTAKRNQVVKAVEPACAPVE